MNKLKLACTTLTVGLVIATLFVLNDTKQELNEMDKEIETINAKLTTIEIRLNNMDKQVAEYKAQAMMSNYIKYYDIIAPNKSNINTKNEVESVTKIDYDVPTIANTDFYGYMDYNCITDDTTVQYDMQQSAWTDWQGLRRYNNDYMVAMGSYYSDYEVGSRFEITLENDTVFTVILGDLKDDIHTDKKNMYTPVYHNWQLVKANVIEFIVEENQLSYDVKKLGTVSGYDNFNGNIVSIKKLINNENNNEKENEKE